MDDLIPGTVWRHYSGRKYIIIALANKTFANPRYPTTVIYKGLTNDNIWTRPSSDWHRSMTKVEDEAIANVKIKVLFL